MYNFALIVLLTILSSNAQAVMTVKDRWVEISSLSDGGTTSYANSDSIIRNGNKVTMWDMLNFNTARDTGGTKLLSAKKRQEYDCVESKTRILGFIMFSGNMGSGTVVGSTSSYSEWFPRDWVPVEANSTNAELLIFACGNMQANLSPP
jgi:hypothetical protein